MGPLSRHERASLSFSGGKDSLACVYLLRDWLDRITVYHLDTGDLLPEVREVVDHVRGMAPHFVTVQTDARKWRRENGLPSDLVPYSQHPIGGYMGDARLRIVHRYECCGANLMAPLWARIKEDGHTLCIRGTKAVDMRRLTVRTGETHEGVEMWLPLQDWTHAEVFAFLKSQGAPLCRIYDHVTNSPECATCPAWWGEKRAAYLKRYHPELWAEYREGVALVMEEIGPSITALATEMRSLTDG